MVSRRNVAATDCTGNDSPYDFIHHRQHAIRSWRSENRTGQPGDDSSAAIPCIFCIASDFSAKRSLVILWALLPARDFSAESRHAADPVGHMDHNLGSTGPADSKWDWRSFIQRSSVIRIFIASTFIGSWSAHFRRG